jgi:hypothetical protein
MRRLKRALTEIRVIRGYYSLLFIIFFVSFVSFVVSPPALSAKQSAQPDRCGVCYGLEATSQNVNIAVSAAKHGRNFSLPNRRPPERSELVAPQRFSRACPLSSLAPQRRLVRAVHSSRCRARCSAREKRYQLQESSFMASFTKPRQTARRRRGVLTLEWILLVTVIVIGVIGGLGVVRNATVGELRDLAEAITHLNVKTAAEVSAEGGGS